MRSCPYCAEQIREAAVLCRFCGRSVTPLGLSSDPPESTRGLRLPSQRWYRVDDRIRATPKAERRRDRTSILAKLGGVLESSELRPNRTGRRQSVIKTYRDLRRYQQGVDRLTRAGWIIERESDPDQHIDGAIVVTWAREPQD